MAKTKGPLFSHEASGKLGSELVFSRRGSTNYVRRRVQPRDPNDPINLGLRHVLGFASSALATLTTEQHAAWAATIDPGRTTIQAALIADAIQRAHRGLTWRATPTAEGGATVHAPEGPLAPAHRPLAVADLIVTGTQNPDVDGSYTYDGDYDGKSSWANTDHGWYIYWRTEDAEWFLSPSKGYGGIGLYWVRTDTEPTGAYSATHGEPDCQIDEATEPSGPEATPQWHAIRIDWSNPADDGEGDGPDWSLAIHAAQQATAPTPSLGNLVAIVPITEQGVSQHKTLLDLTPDVPYSFALRYVNRDGSASPAAEIENVFPT